MTFGTLKATYVDTGTSIIPIEELRSVADLHPVAFSGDYTALLQRPVLGTAAALNAAATLTAGPTEVVLGSDPRLSDARQPTTHTHTSAAVTDFSTAAASAAPVQSVAGRTGSITLSASDISGLAPVATSGSYSTLTGKPGAPEIAALFAADAASTANLKLTLGVTSLSSAAFTGSYTDLLDKPTLGTAAALNAADLRDRSTHTGSQAIATVAGLQDALSSKQPTGSYATLDQSGKVPALQLPSYVDDVVEVANFDTLPSPGEAGKIYITLDGNRTYRWGGSSYTEISPSPGSTDAVPEGSVNLYFTALRAASAAPVQSVAGRSGNVTLSASDISGLATVATSGQYSDLGGKPTLPEFGITTGTQTISVTVAPNASVQVTLTASQVFILQSVAISAAAWVVLYNSGAAALADTQRTQTEDPKPGSGVVAEFVTETSSTIKLSPTTTVISGENPASSSYPVKVKNLGASSTIQLTFTFYKLSP